jgi:hypothetical protein
VVARPLRRGVAIFIVALIIEYLVVPELTGASKDLYLLGGVNAYWLAAWSSRAFRCSATAC